MRDLRGTLDLKPFNKQCDFASSYKAALLSLAVFPEDTDIPFYVITDYWQELTKEKIGSEQIDAEKAETIRTRLHDLSFFRDYDTQVKKLRIHDVLLGYFRL